MKTKLITTFLFLIVTSSQVLAVRPSIGDLLQGINILIDNLVVCPPNSPTRFVDNGDGTICDHETGLMWEMKNASDGVMDALNPRDVDNTYPWSGEGSSPNTAFTGFLTRLNGEKARTAASEQLGSYSDWRLPTSAELQTIRNCNSGSGTEIATPCIDPIFGPTAISSYWTSSSRAGFSSSAWTVGFGSFIPVSISDKFINRHVRAVRGAGRAPSGPVVRNPVIGIGSR